MSAIPAGSVKKYLEGQGIPRGIVDWKYFDERFNRGRERGYVLLRDGEVAGFLGAIPFRMRIGRAETVDTAWSCDWSAAADAGAAGILLVKQLLCSYDPYFQIGGNDNTLRIMPRVAAFTLRDAGVLMYLPLRLGSLLRLARRRAPRLPLDAFEFLNRLPLPSRPRRSNCEARIEDGVSPALAPVLRAACPGEIFPQYDFEYVDWQIGRCPALDAITVLAPGAAAVCWRQKPAGPAWRMALWAEPGAGAGLDSVLCAALRHIYDRGAEIAYVLASKRDTALLTLLGRSGFRMAPRRRMFCAVARAKGDFEEPSGLSLLDSDMAYRFGE